MGKETDSHWKEFLEGVPVGLVCPWLRQNFNLEMSIFSETNDTYHFLSSYYFAYLINKWPSMLSYPYYR